MLDDFSLGVWKRPHNTFQSVEVTHRPERSPVRVSVCKLRGVEYDHLAQGIHQGEEVQDQPSVFRAILDPRKRPTSGHVRVLFPFVVYDQGARALCAQVDGADLSLAANHLPRAAFRKVPDPVRQGNAL